MRNTTDRKTLFLYPIVKKFIVKKMGANPPMFRKTFTNEGREAPRVAVAPFFSHCF